MVEVDIEVLLTLDADDPRLQIGIARLLGYKIERLDKDPYRGYVLRHPDGGVEFVDRDMPDDGVDAWRRTFWNPTIHRRMIPRWPHSIDAAMGLIDTRTVGYTMRCDDGVVHRFAILGMLTHEFLGSSTANSAALAICRAWLMMVQRMGIDLSRAYYVSRNWELLK